MTSIAIGLAVLAALAVAGMLLFRRSGAAPAQPSAKALGGPLTPAVQGAAHPAAPALAQALPTPPELAQLVLLRADDLPAERRASYLAVFHDVPRPSRLLHQLLLPDFVNDASSAQLSDLIRPEPLLAAKVLAAVNSPLYGLSRPVTGVDQAVVYLGVDSVRVLCLRYTLAKSFKSNHPESQRLLETLWSASAMASELTLRLAQPLGLAQRGAMVSAVVLSFLGRLATVASTPAGILSTIPPRGLLERKRAEQHKLGLSASEIGRLLMTDWGLPAEVTADAADLDRLLAWDTDALDSQRSTRLGLCYVCARLGERLAHGELAQLSDFDLATDPNPEFFHLHRLLDATTLARLSGLLKSPDLAVAMARMRLAPKA
jgi:HD-like signal output (HDOD) protein